MLYTFLYRTYISIFYGFPLWLIDFIELINDTTFCYSFDWCTSVTDFPCKTEQIATTNSSLATYKWSVQNKFSQNVLLCKIAGRNHSMYCYIYIVFFVQTHVFLSLSWILMVFFAKVTIHSWFCSQKSQCSLDIQVTQLFLSK